jgi:hypothetical protein
VTNSGTDVANFARLIESIEPWLDQAVIIGGWAHRLYRLHPSARAVEYPPLTTFDADVALPIRLEVNEQDIRERLVANGFREEFLGDHQPPATHYRLGDAKSGFYAEFLTPLIGSQYDRKGTAKATGRVGGVTSQKLRHLDLLLNMPWHVELDESKGFPLAPPKRVQIPNPTCFLAQKLLIHSKRSPEERAKDIVYIHDALEIFSGRIQDLNAIWRAVRLQQNARHRRTIELAPKRLFGEVSDTFREAARMAVARRLSPQAIVETCNLGLSRIFH